MKFYSDKYTEKREIEPAFLIFIVIFAFGLTIYKMEQEDIQKKESKGAHVLVSLSVYVVAFLFLSVVFSMLGYIVIGLPGTSSLTLSQYAIIQSATLLAAVFQHILFLSILIIGRYRTWGSAPNGVEEISCMDYWLLWFYMVVGLGFRCYRER